MNQNAELVRQLLALLAPAATDSASASDGPWKVGTSYLIRTVTMTWTGRLVSVSPQELVLADAAWIADTGRYHLATNIAALSEVEPVEGPVVIGRGSIVDARVWDSPLPREAK